MPIYEYQCKACSERHEVLQKFSDGPLRKCPSCGKLKLKRLVSAAAFHLKGSGWYVTDFRDNGKGKSKGEGDTAGGDAAVTSDAKPEAKPEAATNAATDSKAEARSDKKTEAKPATGKDKKTSGGTAAASSD